MPKFMKSFLLNRACLQLKQSKSLFLFATKSLRRKILVASCLFVFVAFFLSFFLLFISCDKSKTNKIEVDKKVDSTSVNEKKSENISQKKEIWYDKLMLNYVKNSENELIKLALKNKENVEWVLDRTEVTDSTNYYIFNVGQDVFDEGNTNLRFSTCGWIYIDSLSQKIYEYDLPNETLVFWNKKYAH